MKFLSPIFLLFAIYAGSYEVTTSSGTSKGYLDNKVINWDEDPEGSRGTETVVQKGL